MQSLSFVLQVFHDWTTCTFSASLWRSSTFHWSRSQWVLAASSCSGFLALQWFPAYPQLYARSCCWWYICCNTLSCWQWGCHTFVVRAGLAGFHQSFHKVFINWWHKWIHRFYVFLLVSSQPVSISWCSSNMKCLVLLSLALGWTGSYKKTARFCHRYCHKLFAGVKARLQSYVT